MEDGEPLGAGNILCSKSLDSLSESKTEVEGLKRGLVASLSLYCQLPNNDTKTY